MKQFSFGILWRGETKGKNLHIKIIIRRRSISSDARSILNLRIHSINRRFRHQQQHVNSPIDGICTPETKSRGEEITIRGFHRAGFSHEMIGGAEGRDSAET